MRIIDVIRSFIRRVSDADPDRYCDVVRLRRLARDRVIIPASAAKR